MKKAVALLLVLFLILQFIPSGSAVQDDHGEIYSSAYFKSCYLNVLFRLVYSYIDKGYDMVDSDTIIDCLWTDPAPKINGAELRYFSSNNTVIISAVYSGQVDENKAADKIEITFQPQNELSSDVNKHIRMLLELNLALSIAVMDGSDEDAVGDFIDTEDEMISAYPMQLKGGYWLTVSKNGSSYSYEMSKPNSSETSKAAIPSAGTQSGMIYCPECGKQIAAGSKFCMYCGRSIPSGSSDSNGGTTTLPPTPQPAWSSWSSWSTSPVYNSATRQVETRTIVKGYNMFHYRTQYKDSPHPRVFRDYSINGDYNWKYSRESYGEKYLEKYVSASEFANATVYYPDSKNVYNGRHPGYQDGSTKAYGFTDDEFMWFIASEVTVTEYRYRDLVG